MSEFWLAFTLGAGSMFAFLGGLAVWAWLVEAAPPYDPDHEDEW